MARPSNYSVSTVDKICSRLAQGESLRAICRDDEMPDKKTVLRWLGLHEEFRAQYVRARELQTEYWAEEILEIADDGSNDFYTDNDGTERVNHDVIARSRLRVDSRKWLMSKLAPKKYGDRVTQEFAGADGGALKVHHVIEQHIVDPKS